MHQLFSIPVPAMKRRCILLLLILAPLLTVQAQYLRFGGKAGGGLSKAVGDNASEMSRLAGMQAGLLLSYEFVSSLAVQAELSYAQKGFTYNKQPIYQDEYVSGDMRLHYLEFPLLLKVQKRGLFAEAGPYVAYMLGNSSDIHRFSTRNAPSEPIDLGQEPFPINNFNRWDYGYAVGTGFRLDNGFFVSLRYTSGLHSFPKHLDQKNQVWQLSIGFLMAPRDPASLM